MDAPASGAERHTVQALSKQHAEAYLEVAERSLKAAQATIQAHLHEKAAFMAYHAFESAGGAFCAARGVAYPVSHEKKLNVFKASARLERFGLQVAELSVLVASLRNRCLYPTVTGSGEVHTPQSQLTAAEARRLLGRVRALVDRVTKTV